jgi:hypothetical protein
MREPKRKARYGAVCLKKVPDPNLPGAFLFCTMSKGHRGPHVATKCGLFRRGFHRDADPFAGKHKVPVYGDVLAVWPLKGSP